MTGKVFKRGFIPSVEDMPAEKTHKRAKLIFNILRVLVFFTPHKQEAAMKEIQTTNTVLYDRVRKYLTELTPEEIAFFKGPRPTHHEDGTLAIYDPVKDNPLLVRVYAGEEPDDASSIWTPGASIGHELSELRGANRILVGRN